MTSGRLTVIAIVVATILFGLGVWWTQTRAYLFTVDLDELPLELADGSDLVVTPQGFEGLDANSSPLRFRACFALDQAAADTLRAGGFAYEGATPLTTVGWFDCYDARAIGEALEAGEAEAFLGRRDIAPGIDRVLALYPNGQVYVWHQLNDTLE
ncbi:DUF6446 family protein [Gymnodinialimonas sp. 2305UL16-5]|uniref:DUF6446 family protein n=1 Tax=Gymnodinialimonas mytili TaxID=3126503 RepID=UPI0030AA771A